MLESCGWLEIEAVRKLTRLPGSRQFMLLLRARRWARWFAYSSEGHSTRRIPLRAS
jgi:hypothetical protein